MQHIHIIADSNRQCAARTAFADNRAQNRYAQACQFIQVSADGLGLAALFRTDTRICPGRVYKSHNRQIEFFRRLHQPQSLPITFGAGHTEIAADFLFGVPTFLMADNDNTLAVEPRQATDDGMIVRVMTVAVQFLEISEKRIYIIIGIRTLGMAGNL